MNPYRKHRDTLARVRANQFGKPTDLHARHAGYPSLAALESAAATEGQSERTDLPGVVSAERAAAAARAEASRRLEEANEAVSMANRLIEDRDRLVGLIARFGEVLAKLDGMVAGFERERAGYEEALVENWSDPRFVLETPDPFVFARHCKVIARVVEDEVEVRAWRKAKTRVAARLGELRTEFDAVMAALNGKKANE